MTDPDPTPIYTELARQWAEAGQPDAGRLEDPLGAADQVAAPACES